jgi:hypothetical protein
MDETSYKSYPLAKIAIDCDKPSLSTVTICASYFTASFFFMLKTRTEYLSQ